jgi:hypothetical protein
MAESGAAFTLTGAGARALFCTLAGLTYRQLCWARATAKRDGCRHRPHRAPPERDKANPETVYDPEHF